MEPLIHTLVVFLNVSYKVRMFNYCFIIVSVGIFIRNVIFYVHMKNGL